MRLPGPGGRTGHGQRGGVGSEAVLGGGHQDDSADTRARSTSAHDPYRPVRMDGVPASCELTRIDGVEPTGTGASQRDTVDETQVQASDPLTDRAQVRIFTLADHVADERSEKLYISGGGLEWTGLPARAHEIPGCYLVIRLAFPRESARPQHGIVVRAVDEAGNSVGPDPLMEATMTFDLDRVPEDFSEVSGHIIVEIVGYPVTVDPTGVIVLELTADGVVVSRLPVQLVPVDD